MVHYGIRGLNWFQSYLTNRKQKTSMKGVLSDTTIITHGVPHGFGPIVIFNLYQ